MTLPSQPASSSGQQADPLMGATLGERYRVDELIARGGMARVYRARDTRLERDVALKVLSHPYADNADFTRRFLAEARTAASLTHPNLVHVYDSGASDGAHYIVMELLVGYRSLRAILAERQHLPVPAAVAIVRSVLSGLELVHANGLVHADVKSGNVMVGPGMTKLIDFGIARGPRETADDGTSLGSLHTMSPEQLRGERLGPESDCFAVGVVLYQALTGQVPYPGGDPESVAARQESHVTPPPSSLVDGVGQRLDRVILQALNPDRAVRFSSAHGMSHALEVAARDEPDPRGSEQTTQVIALPPRSTRRRRPAAPRRRRSALPLAMLVVLIGLALAVAVAFTTGAIRLPDIGLPVGPDLSTPGASTLPAGMIRVPDTIGMSEQQAEAAAREAGLDWEIRWREVADHQPGIYDQQPGPGTVARRGSRFTMYAYRSPD